MLELPTSVVCYFFLLPAQTSKLHATARKRLRRMVTGMIRAGLIFYTVLLRCGL
jgi:hypothetical protein